jgi:nitrogen fixation/metabolism regulation signal transduction histidine kinase
MRGPTEPTGPDEGSRIDRRVLVGIVALTLAATVALFGLPVLLDTGMSFETAFWTIAAVELVAALGIVVLVFRLTGD